MTKTLPTVSQFVKKRKKRKKKRYIVAIHSKKMCTEQINQKTNKTVQITTLLLSITSHNHMTLKTKQKLYVWYAIIVIAWLQVERLR